MQRVIIELSGGVDSSVAAYLLKKEGYDVIGATFNIWRADACYDNPKNCCNEESAVYAKRVADYLDIPHYNICLKDIFYEKVVKDFINKYKSALTPNPCIRCNEYIKFNALAEKLEYLAPFKLATGHYARIVYDEKEKKYRLFKGVDSKKDQSYFLYCLKQNMLENILFPLGNLTKIQVREIAKEKKLPTQAKPESQEICFVPDADYKKFFKLINIKAKPGNIYDTSGKKIGAHNGIINYTIGQRRGLGISSAKPLYVISINAKNNSIIVGENEYLFTNKVRVENINWIAGINNIHRLRGASEIHANVRIRYNMKEQPALIKPTGKDKAEIIFDTPVRAATPGQAAVFYNKDEALGGGIIY